MLQTYIKMLNTIYNKYDALYYNDCDSIGFEWMSCDDSEHSTVAFVRRGSTTKKQLLFLCNFTPITQKGYQIGVPCNGRYTEILRSDEIRFGGVYKKKLQTYKAIKNECDGREYLITMDVPPLSTIILSYDFKEEKA